MNSKTIPQKSDTGVDMLKPTKLIVMWVQAWNAWGIDCEDQFGNWYAIDEFYGEIFHKKIGAISAAREWKKRNQVPEIVIGNKQTQW